MRLGLLHHKTAISRILGFLGVAMFMMICAFPLGAEPPSHDQLPLITIGPEGIPVTPVDLHASDEKNGLPQFDAQWFPSQLFWLAVMFSILYVFFARVALPRIAHTITQRAEIIHQDIVTAETLTQQAQTIRQSYEQDIAKAHDRATAALRAVDARIKEKTNDMLYSYRTKVTLEIARAEETLEREKTKLLSEMRDIAARIAGETSGQILQMAPDYDLATQIVNQIEPNKQAA